MLLKHEAVLDLLLITQEKLLHWIGTTRDSQWILKLISSQMATILNLFIYLFIDSYNVQGREQGRELDAHNGIVNGSNAFIKKLTILANGREVYSCNYANHCVNIKNVLEYSPTYANNIATNEFYFLDTSRNPAEDKYNTRQVQHGRNDVGNGWEAKNFLDTTNNNYNKGFAGRKALLGTSSTVNCEIPINRYSFFKSLKNKLLPNTRIELNLEIGKDNNLIWQNGANCRIIITRLQLFVPRLIFNAGKQKLYMEII